MIVNKQPLGLIYNEEIRLFLQKRGGICIAGSKRHCEANNKYMKNYTSEEQSNFILYLDMNGLYAGAMTDYLPHNILGFDDDVKLDEIMKLPLNGDIGYFVEVDIEIPRELHSYLKDYPPCPENMNIKYEWLDDYQKNILKINNNKFSKDNKKLVLNLFDKTNYFCHYKYLQCIEKLGIKITRLNKALKFEQSQWMKPFIDLNQKLRAQAKNKFEQGLLSERTYKLIIAGTKESMR